MDIDGAPARARRSLKFCPESNDLLYPRENRATRRLEFYCRNCSHVEEAEPEDYCVHVARIKHDAKEQTIVLQDVRADPTLPRTKDVACPACGHQEAVFFSQSSEVGMTLYFNCCACGHRWREQV
ncbi:DNA-directed RNA polymerase IV and V subunit 9A [Raphidocelis subcapitata]|uniref:DNA-directed RNA polymerase subunit n=1 Tax=Raphidocelis subcapitata TaxID=307507 RepID=A0A2V0NYJ1_9CHLO|nr:DNA-directed RNA polymerase IV and V subunit 9A [Raphidocelis subcapitata]|eukprot:GBF92708.1 DNA-directed RNA polymerase IV and V subunit 9A [Raphidocelis subcapitata]